MPDFGAGGRRLARRGGVVFCAAEPARLVDAAFLADVFFAGVFFGGGVFFAGVFVAGFAGFLVGALSEYSAAESSDRRVDRGWRAFLVGLSDITSPPRCGTQDINVLDEFAAI
jgi:hypothetical protein